MVDPKKAKEIVIASINETTREQLGEGASIHLPHDDADKTPVKEGLPRAAVGQLSLFRPSDAPLPLQAYLASALTGLDKDQRSLIFQISDAISLICRKHGIDLYEPRKKTDPVHHAHVEDMEVFKTDRERVLESDLLIFLSHYPSTGAGQELDFAYSALLPIILISRSGDKVSRMVTGMPNLKVHLQYEEPEELREKLDSCMDTVKPIIEERKLAYSGYDRNLVGQRIRTLREQLGLTRKDIATNVKYFTEADLKLLEESTDKAGNPSLMHLRQIAVLLKTTVADLVEPDMGARVVSFLTDWVEGRQAARYSTISDEDRKKIMRRVLLRVIDQLEK